MSHRARRPPSIDPADRVIDILEPRSPSPEYYVDLTVDSPMNLRPLAPGRIGRMPRRNQRYPVVLGSNEMPDVEVIDPSNRPLPPTNRNRSSHRPKETPIINLDETAPEEGTTMVAVAAAVVAVTEETARVNNPISPDSDIVSSVCPICLEHLTLKRKPTTTRCGHVYCEECIQQTLKMSKKCPKCQGAITPKSCIRLFF